MPAAPATLLAVASAVLLRVVAAAGQDDRDARVRALQRLSWEVRAVRLKGELRFDGRVDEPAWELAEPVVDFYQRERNEGLPATERTEVRVLYDDANLYFGFRCFDSEAERVDPRAVFRDESASSDDQISFMIDAFHDHRSAMQFGTNANGVVIDSLQTGETPQTRDTNWNAVWTARGSRRAYGWEAEVVMPFKSLRFRAPLAGEEVIFGIGFKRNIPRKNEEDYWPFVSNDSTWYRPAELGHLRGLRGVRPGRNLEFRPYALGGGLWEAQPRQRPGTARMNVGLDVKWAATSGLMADLSLNTDFAQEEADIQQVNLTRFSLFFPEKRQFFLESQRNFRFGVPAEMDLVFTRRIGLSDAGEIVPIRAGARLAGRQGRWTIGAMQVQTEQTQPLPAENMTVLRVRRDLLKRSSVGAVFTSRQGDGAINRVVGLDLNLFFKEIWFLDGFVAAQDEGGRRSANTAAYARMAYETDLVGVTYRFLDVGENFRPGLGYVRRPDSRENFGQLRYSPRPRAGWVRQSVLTGSLRYVTNQRGALETRDRAAQLSLRLERGDVLWFGYTSRLESLDAPFRLRRDVVVAPGVYRFGTFEARLESFRGRPGRVTLSFDTGRFWNGRRSTLSAGGNYRINKHVGIGGSYETNRVSLPLRDFTTALVSSRIQFALRADTVLLALLQYNRDTGLLSSNLRFHWIPKPGTDFFVVYNEVDERRELTRGRSRSLVVKLNYRIAL